MAKLVTIATLSVLAVGGLIASGIVWSLHRYGGGSSCPPATSGATVAVSSSGPEIDDPGWVLIGDSADMRESAEQSPYYGNLGGRCEYWVVLDKGALAAYKARLPGSKCAVKWKDARKTFVCNQTKQPIALTELPRWPSRLITSGPNKNTFEIYFG
jgi:hypothetical protein